MKTNHNQLRTALLAVTVLVLLTGESALCVDYINYRLLSGSTITPRYCDQVTGLTENLSGTFQWYEFDAGSPDLRGFDASYLRFQSTSYTLNLNTTSLNNFGTSVWNDSNTTAFGEVVDITGLPIATGELRSNFFAWGWYSGPSNRPTYLTYPAIDLYPVDGGAVYGRLTLYAEPVPEPATLLLLGLGAVMLRKRKK